MPLGRVKVWGEEVLLYTDLNNEFNNLCNNVVVEPVTFTQTVDLNGKTLILDDDGNTSLDATVNDTIDITIAGADDFRLTANLLTLLSGSSLSVASGNITIDAGNLTITDGNTILANPDSRTNTVATPLTIRSETTGSPAAGIGAGLLIQAESGDEAPSDFGQLEFAASDVNAGSEDTYFQVLLRVAGAALSAAYRFVTTTANKAIFTHANSADRTYTLQDSSDTLVGRNTTDTLTNKTIDSNANTITIRTGGLSTATGSASGLDNAVLDVTMNDYAFFPATFHSLSQNIGMASFSGTDPSNTTSRFSFLGTGGGNTVGARWRYITASDNPTIWVVQHNLTGLIVGVWTSDDPTTGDVPGLSSTNCTSIRLKACDLEGLSVLTGTANEAADYIREHKLGMQHQAYRALQLMTGDDAPSQWLLKNCTLTNGRLEMMH